MSIEDNLVRIRAEIDQACQAAGRDPGEVRLLPVSKTHPVAAIRQAASAGCRWFAENRPQELAAKAAELSGLGLHWVMIGHLQRNKARLVAEFADSFHGLDSLQLAADLDRRLAVAGRELEVLVQVNSSDEPTKSGLRPEQVPAFMAGLGEFGRLRVTGLMTIAANTTDRESVIACFELMRDLQAGLRADPVPGQRYDELSMGMSGDFVEAIAHGATIVRIGTAIFGTRSAPPLG